MMVRQTPTASNQSHSSSSHSITPQHVDLTIGDIDDPDDPPLVVNRKQPTARRLNKQTYAQQQRQHQYLAQERLFSEPQSYPSTVAPHKTSRYSSTSDISLPTRNASNVPSGKGSELNAAQPKKKNFSYTHEHERYLATIFAEPKTWALLNGSAEKNSLNKSRLAIRESVCKRFNTKFSTIERVVQLDERQIKNKISTMTQIWTEGLKEYKKAENGDLPRNDLEEKVKNKCHFFFILYERWSPNTPLNPPETTQITENITQNNASVARDSEADEEGEEEKQEEEEEEEEEKDDDDNGSDDGQEAPAGDEPFSINTIVNNSLHNSSEKKKRSTVPDHLLLLLEDLIDQTKESLNLKRRKIELQEKAWEKQETLMDLQIMKLQTEIGLQDQDLENERRKRETEKLRLQEERKSVLAASSQPEQEKGNPPESWIEIDLTRSAAGQPEKAALRIKMAPPPPCPS